MTGQRRALNADAMALHYEEDLSAAAPAAPPISETQYLWFNSFIRPEDVVDSQEHMPRIQFGVTGKQRTKPGTKRSFSLGSKVVVNGTTVAIFRYAHYYFAIENSCPHQGGSLHLGDIEDYEGTLCISCPRHRWPFSLGEGNCMIRPNLQAQIYPVDIRRQRDGSRFIFVGFESFSESVFCDDDF